MTLFTLSHAVTLLHSALHLHERLRFPHDAAGRKLVELHEAVASVDSEALHVPSSVAVAAGVLSITHAQPVSLGNCGTIELLRGTAGQWRNLRDSPPKCGTLGNYV